MMHRDHAHTHTARHAVISFLSKSPADTRAAGARIGALLLPGSVVGLVGELGAGKTCLIKAMAYGINKTSEHDVTSPTFAIVHEYGGSPPLYHIDAYRINSIADLEPVGFDDCMDAGGIVIVEWADRIIDALPEHRLMIHLAVISEYERYLSCQACGTEYCVMLNKLRNDFKMLRNL